MTPKTALLIGMVLAAAAWLPASAQTPYSAPPPQSSVNPPPPPIPACPAGTHWEEAGYVGHGKYRPARCARDNGRE
jgi:hypothetical protein